MVGDLSGSTIRCLGEEADGADEFQDFIRLRRKKDVFVRFWKL